MLNVGGKIIEFRKRNNWSESKLAKAVEASGDFIGKYERNENSPSIRVAFKISKVFDVPLDYLLGEGRYANYDDHTVQRIEKIRVLEVSTKSILFNLIDTYHPDAKTGIGHK